MTVFIAKDKIRIFKEKLKFWKIIICHCKSASFTIFKHFSDEFDRY